MERLGLELGAVLAVWNIFRVKSESIRVSASFWVDSLLDKTLSTSYTKDHQHNGFFLANFDVNRARLQRRQLGRRCSV